MHRVAVVACLLVGCGSKPPAPTVPPPEDVRASEAALAAGCDRDQVAACMELATRLADGEGVEVDTPRASKLFDRACRLGEQDGCARYAIGVAQGLVEGDLARAYKLATTACAKGFQRGCRGAGYMQLEGKGTARDEAAAIATLTTACEAKDGSSCGLLAIIQLDSGQDPDQARALAMRGCDLEAAMACYVAAAATSEPTASFALLDRACDLGDGEACTRYGASLLVGHGVPADVPRAIQRLERGCHLGAVESCRALGAALLSSSPGVPHDDDKAARVLKRACDGGDLAGCGALGVAYATGRGVEKSPVLAYSLLRKSCDEGTSEATASGCYYLGLSHLRGEGAAQSYAESARYFERACDRKWGEACAALADQYALGQGFAVDVHQAAQLHRRACELNHAPSCTKQP